MFVPLQGGLIPGGIKLNVVARIGPKSARNDPAFRWTVDSAAMATYIGVQVTGTDDGESVGETNYHIQDEGLTKIRMIFDVDYNAVTGTNESENEFKALLRKELVNGPTDFGLTDERIVRIILSEGSLIADIYIKDSIIDGNDDLYNYFPGVAGSSIETVESMNAASSIKSNVTMCDFCIVFEGDLLCPHLENEKSCPPIPHVCEDVACYHNRVCKPIPVAARAKYIDEHAAATHLSLGSGYFSSGSSESELLDFTCACASTLKFGANCGELPNMNVTALERYKVVKPILELRDIAIIIAVSCIILVSTILLLHHFRTPVVRAKNAETAVLAELGAFAPFANMSHMNPDQELEWEEGICDISGKPTATALAKSRALDDDSFALFAENSHMNHGQRTDDKISFAFLHENRQRSDGSSGVGSEKISNLLATTGALRGWNTEDDLASVNRDSMDGHELVWNDNGSIHGAPSTDFGSAADAISFTHFPQLSGPRSIHTVFTNPDASELSAGDLGSGLGASGLALDEDGLPMGEEIDAVYQMARIQMMQNHEDRVDAVWDMAQDGERSHAILQATPDLDDDGMESPIFSPLGVSLNSTSSPSTALKDMTARHLGQANGNAIIRKPGMIHFSKLTSEMPTAYSRATPEGFENSFSEHMHDDSELFSENEGYSLIPGDQTQAVGRHNDTEHSVASDGYARIHGEMTVDSNTMLMMSPFSDGDRSEDGEGYAMIEDDGPQRYASGMPVNSSPAFRVPEDENNIYETAVPGNKYNDISGSSTVYETAAAAKIKADHAAAAHTVYQTAAAGGPKRHSRDQGSTVYETASSSNRTAASTVYETAASGRPTISMTQTRPDSQFANVNMSVVYATAGSTARPVTHYETAMPYDGPMYEAATQGPNYSVAMRQQAKQGHAIYTRAAPSYKPAYPEATYEIASSGAGAGAGAGLANATPQELLESLQPRGKAAQRIKSIKRYHAASIKYGARDNETVAYDPATVPTHSKAGNTVSEYQTIDPNLQLTDSKAFGPQDHDGDFSYDELTVAAMDSAPRSIGLSPASKKYEV